MQLRACFEYLISRWTDELVVTAAGNASSVWWELTGDRDRVFYLEASMGLVSMFASGMALGLPDTRVWAFSGDGGFAMNPGMLMVERQMGLPNLTHFLVSNRCYGATGELALPNAAENDYPAVARAFGIERVYGFDSLEALRRDFDDAVGGPGPTFVVLEVEPLNTRLSAVPVDGAEQKFRFGRHIERTAGVQVFDH